MIFKILAAVMVIALVIVGIGVYLSPDDLADCSSVSQDGSCRQADAVVVVSGGDTMARTDEAIKLFRAGWAPLIVFSGAAADKDGPSNAEVMHRRATDLGVPEAAAIIEGESETTKQNAEQVKRQLEQRGVRSIILVTSGYHLRRAGLEFSSQFGDIEVRRHPAADDRHWGALWWLTPWGWWLALGELVKICTFYIGVSR